jgi:hypothetical protein
MEAVLFVLEPMAGLAFAVEALAREERLDAKRPSTSLQRVGRTHCN